MGKVIFISTGGTIGNAGTGNPIDYLSYLSEGRVMSGNEFMAGFEQASQLPEIEVIEFGQLRSKWMNFSEWTKLHHTVGTALQRDDVDGVVISHGTGTLEETAYFLHLTIDSPKPVVLVGAQRPSSTLGSDAHLNFLDAVRVASNPSARSRGVLVVMGQTIHSARDVTKTANHQLNAMRSPNSGPVGKVLVNGDIAFLCLPKNSGPKDSPVNFQEYITGQEAPRVDIVYEYVGADEVVLEAFIKNGARGIIAVGFAPGTNTKAIDDAIDRAVAEGIVVVQATRAWTDSQVMDRTELQDRSIIPSTDVTPQHARILLQLCLLAGFSHEKIRTVFATS